jgi:hypothetical protein
MKKINSKILYALIAIIALSFHSCIKDNTQAPDPVPPTMQSIAITGSGKVFEATLTFSEAVYKTASASGSLDNSSFTINMNGGVASIESTEVSHVAGSTTAVITINLDEYSDGNEQMTVQPASAYSIYNAAGTPLELSQSKTITMGGTTHDEIAITDQGNGTGTVSWTANNTYILHGFVFVNDGQTLTIEAGTIIKGAEGQEADASALIVARGGKIIAEGTAEKPIIFTSVLDDLNGSVSLKQRGLWGGLIVLGKATLNSSPGVSNIEGIPTTEPRGEYGGSDDADNSGIIKYVSIRHGGTDIGEGNEINGITLGGVGSGTVIDFVEVIANADDGIEFFGGTPHVKHAVIAYCGDDSFDYDEGFRGQGQFWLAVQDESDGDRIGEHDGGTDPETAEPYATPYIYNATYIGRGESAGKRSITFRDNAGGFYRNSIFLNQAKGIDIENLASADDSYARFVEGNLKIEGNIFYNVAGQTDGTDAAANGAALFTISGNGADATDLSNSQTNFAAYFATANNVVSNPGVSAAQPIPANNVTGNMAAIEGTTANFDAAFFDNVSYKGAFDPSGSNWASWTRLYK